MTSHAFMHVCTMLQRGRSPWYGACAAQVCRWKCHQSTLPADTLDVSPAPAHYVAQRWADYILVVSPVRSIRACTNAGAGLEGTAKAAGLHWGCSPAHRGHGPSPGHSEGPRSGAACSPCLSSSLTHRKSACTKINDQTCSMGRADAADILPCLVDCRIAANELTQFVHFRANRLKCCIHQIASCCPS